MGAPPRKPKHRLFRTLRLGMRGGAEERIAEGRTAADEGELWAAHQRATTAVRDSGDAAQRIASHIARQRGTVDALSERVRAVSARASDLSSSFVRVADAFARLELVALNAGLEGARLSEAAGHALGLVADEVRAQATRGSEAARELSASMGEIGSELAQVNGSLDRAREAAAEVAQEASRAAGASADAERGLADVGERFKKTSGTDPETSRAIADALEHARSLVAALGILRGKVPHALIVNALRPVLEPLGRMLDGDEREP